MFRILFAIAAVVAAVLALVVEQPLLFVAAGASLGIVPGHGDRSFRASAQRRKRYKANPEPPPDIASDALEGEEEGEEDKHKDLASLGILDIRRKVRPTDPESMKQVLQRRSFRETGRRRPGRTAPRRRTAPALPYPYRAPWIFYSGTVAKRSDIHQRVGP